MSFPPHPADHLSYARPLPLCRAYHAYVSVQTEEAQLGSTEPKNHMAWLTDSQKARPIIPKPLRTLRFKLCNEFADQRLALMYGVLLANVTGRIPVLPELLLKGEQYNNDDNQSSAAEATVPMSEVYDVDRFLEGVSRRAGVRILRPTEAPEFPDYVPFSIAGDWQDWLDKLTQVEAPHVALNCTLLKLGKDAIREKEGLAWAVLDSLKLNERLAGIRDAAVARSAGRKSAGSHVKQRLQRGPAVASELWLGQSLLNLSCFFCPCSFGLRERSKLLVKATF